MKLDYYTALSFAPIKLSVGTIRKPTLNDISELTFPVFEFYQLFIDMTPKRYYKSIGAELKYEDKKNAWDNFSDEEKANMTMFDIITRNDKVKETYLEILNFFFIDTVIFVNDYFYVVKNFDVEKNVITKDNLQGAFGKELFDEVIEVIKQICCISIKEKESDQVFKNNKAREIWRKLHPDDESDKPKKRSNINLTIPNVISSVSANSFNLNIIDIWKITIFQLFDQFNKITLDKQNYLNGINVAVWGDEKNKFDSLGWNKNIYDKND